MHEKFQQTSQSKRWQFVGDNFNELYVLFRVFLNKKELFTLLFLFMQISVARFVLLAY